MIGHWGRFRVRRETLLRQLLSVAMLCSPIWGARLAEGAEPGETLPRGAALCVTPQTIAAATVRPSSLLQEPKLSLLPVEVVEAACQEYLGIASTSIERVTAFVEPPMGTQLFYAVVVDLSEDFSFETIHPQLMAELEKQMQLTTFEGKPILRHSQPMAPSIYMMSDRQLVAAPVPMLKKLLRQQKKRAEGKPFRSSQLIEYLSSKEGAKNHFYAAITLEQIRPLMQMGLTQAKGEVEPQYHHYLDALLKIDAVEATLDVSNERDSYLRLFATDSESADQLIDTYDQAMQEFAEEVYNNPEGPFAQIKESEHPVAIAFVDYMERIDRYNAERHRPARIGDRGLSLGHLPAGESSLLASPLVVTAVIGFLVALLLPAIQAAREAARRNTSQNNMKQLILAFHNYHDTYGHFPPAAITNEAGEALLSWRVAILPFIEEQELYAKFHLDEPWDSPHNINLLDKMPKVFVDPSSTHAEDTSKTNYLAVVGPQCAMTGEADEISFRNITDGTSKTMALVQVASPQVVSWTKPADYDVQKHRDNPVAGIGEIHPGIFLAAFCDGHVEAIDLDIDREMLRAYFTRNGGEPFPDALWAE